MKNKKNPACPNFGKEGVFHTGSLMGTELEMPYSGIRTFMRRRPTQDLTGVDYAVYGIPFDLTTSGRPGARMGPSALREASTQLSWGEVWPWGIDPFDILAVTDFGDVPYRRGQVEEMIENGLSVARKIVDAGVGTILMGGDHCVTYSALKAHAEKHGPLALIHFDAHRDIQQSDYFDHGTFVHHAIEDGLIDPKSSIQIGIRTFYENDDQMQVLYRDWLHEHGWQGALSKIIKTVGDRKAYLSIDIDCIDPAFAPGTGTPVVDGLFPNDVISILRKTVDVDIVGMDLVEVAPPYDSSEITSLLGAQLILEYLCSRAVRKELKMSEADND
jgi:agmatinase